MPVANITVAYVNPPKEGGKMGSIKTNDGQVVRVWADKLSLFQQNGKYTIEYTDESWQGKPYMQFKRMVGSSQSMTPLANGKAATGSPSTTRSEEMAVMGLIGRAIQGTGGIPDEDTLYSWVVAIRGAWTRGFAASLGPQPKTVGMNMMPEIEMNDEIPF